MEHILDIQNITKSYADFSLKNVSFTIPKGCIMGFVGENGAGKTTTIKAIMDMISLDSGKITVFGLDNKEYGKTIRQDIGAVLTESSFPTYMNARQCAKVLASLFDQWDQPLFESYLKRFDLPVHKQIKSLSKGMRMKLNIAMAISHHPKLLILDEATSGLDPIVREEILDLFLEFIQDEEHSILLSSHITSDIEKAADYITFIHEGKIILCEEKDILLEQYGILKTTPEIMMLLDQKDYVNYRKTAYSLEVLVQNKDMILQKVKDAVIDRATLEDIMLFTVKGERL